MTSNIVLCAPVLTAIGAYGGALKEMAAPQLGRTAINEALIRAGIQPRAIDSLVMGRYFPDM